MMTFWWHAQAESTTNCGQLTNGRSHPRARTHTYSVHTPHTHVWHGAEWAENCVHLLYEFKYASHMRNTDDTTRYWFLVYRFEVDSATVIRMELNTVYIIVNFIRYLLCANHLSTLQRLHDTPTIQRQIVNAFAIPFIYWLILRN